MHGRCGNSTEILSGNRLTGSGRMAKLWNSLGRSQVVVVLLTISLLAWTGVAAAAVEGDFTSSYDGYGDGSDTDVRGHEIQVSGPIEFTGENAVEPSITVRPSQNTVLADGSVELLQTGESTVDFEKNYISDGVRYSATEISSGKQFDLSYVVYPISGLDQSEIKSSEVIIRYETPSGEPVTKRNEVTTSLDNTPVQIIDSQQSEEQVHIAVWVLAGIGGLTALIVVIMALYSGVKQIGGTGGPP